MLCQEREQTPKLFSFTRTVPITEPKTKVDEDTTAINAVDHFRVEKYASIVGVLIYMAITCRADIAPQTHPPLLRLSALTRATRRASPRTWSPSRAPTV